MNRSSRAIFLAAGLFVATVATSQAETIDFSSFYPTDYSPVPNGFGGLNYTNFYLVNSGSNAQFVPGFNGPEVAYNTFALNTALSPVSGTMTLLGLDIAAGQVPTTVTITGTEAGGGTESVSEVLASGIVTPVILGWTDLTNVTFSTPGGSFNSSGEYFAIDDISIASPEPSSLVLLGTGLVAAAGAARRKLRK